MPSLTQIKQYAIEEGKKIIYLVLKKKPLSAEIIEKLSNLYHSTNINLLAKYIRRNINE